MFKAFVFAVITSVLVIASAFFLPWNQINWGRISILPAATITVTGTANSQTKNQIATFTASITSVNSDKQKATDDVNSKMTALISSVKALGIADSDIKTESINVYQQPVPLPLQGTNSGTSTLIYPMPPVPAPSGNGNWQATNSITITLRDLSKASILADTLNKSGATNVYGPNLTVDNTSAAESDLLAKAMEDARNKALVITKVANQTLGKVINVQENGSSYPYPVGFMGMAKADTSTPIQPGTTNLTKSVTVVFEIR